MIKQNNCGLWIDFSELSRAADCGFRSNGNGRNGMGIRATLKRTRLGVRSEDVGATVRAASVSASGTQSGGYGKTQDRNRPVQFQICGFKFQIEQQKQQDKLRMSWSLVPGPWSLSLESSEPQVRSRCCRRHHRRGAILIVAMWIVLVLAGLVLTLARAMQTENVCSANEYAAARADAVEQGAIQYVLAHVDSQYGKFPTDTEMPCEAVRIGDGMFWIIRSNDTTDDTTPRFGLTDESAKFNLNLSTTATITPAIKKNMLMMLPNMTEELAASIIDWYDTDSNTTTNGAESDYYLVQPDPYQCKNGPLETVDELYLIKGASADIIEGEDVNLNGILDAGEDTTGDGRLDRGFYPFVTVYSSDPNKDSTGAAKIDVNNASEQQLRDLLGPNFSSDRVNTLIGQITRARRTRFTSVLDFYKKIGLVDDDFNLIADKVTTSNNAQKGLINVNTAPKEVLSVLTAVPNGLTDADVTALISRRAENIQDQTNIAWLAKLFTSRDKLQTIGRYVTTQTYQFSADIVSVSENGRAFRRCRVVIDASTSPPKIIYRQDLTQLGWPLSQDILTKLRAGAGLDSITPGMTVRQEVAR